METLKMKYMPDFEGDEPSFRDRRSRSLWMGWLTLYGEKPNAIVYLNDSEIATYYENGLIDQEKIVWTERNS